MYENGNETLEAAAQLPLHLKATLQQIPPERRRFIVSDVSETLEVNELTRSNLCKPEERGAEASEGSESQPAWRPWNVTEHRVPSVIRGPSRFNPVS